MSSGKSMSPVSRVFRTLGLLLAAVVAAAVIYVAYVLLSYHRIPDDQRLSVVKGTAGAVSPGTVYTAVTYNIGYGSYPPDFTFFMDGGKESRARSAEAVLDCIEGDVGLLQDVDPDFMLLQEVDINATRSLHINEYRHMCIPFYNYDSVSAVNYDSAYLLYPFREPYGKSKSAIATFSRYAIEDGVRRSLPITKGFGKLVDLDRCYSVASIPVVNGKTLRLYNVHLSAYANGGGVSERQLTALLTDMQEKAELGDYVVCGGDFNLDFTGDSIEQLNAAPVERLSWAQPFPEELVPEGIRLCRAYPGKTLTPTARSLDAPYVKGESLTLILDGFLLSDNVRCIGVENLDWEFALSDHNPVRLRFSLEED